MKIVKIYGCSDDLVEIEGSMYWENEIGCYEMNVRIWFEDGTIILIGYPKKDLAVWWIRVEKEGTSFRVVIPCDNEDDDVYSDVLYIGSEIVRHELVMKTAEPERLHHKVERFENLMYKGCELHWHCVRCGGYWPFHCFGRADLEAMECKGESKETRNE